MLKVLHTLSPKLAVQRLKEKWLLSALAWTKKANANAVVSMVIKDIFENSKFYKSRDTWYFKNYAQRPLCLMLWIGPEKSMSSVALHIIRSIILTFETVNSLMVLIHQTLSPLRVSPSTSWIVLFLRYLWLQFGHCSFGDSWPRKRGECLGYELTVHTVFFWNMVAHPRLTSLEGCL